MALCVFAWQRGSSGVALAAETKRLDRAEIVQLLLNGEAKRIQEAVKKRGINFIPDEDYLQTLREGGAWELLIETLKQAAPASPAQDASGGAQRASTSAGISPLKPLDADEVLALAHHPPDTVRTNQIVRLYHLSFTVTNEFLKSMQEAGAESWMVDVVRGAQVVPPYLDQAVPQRVIVAREVMENKVVHSRPGEYPGLAALGRIQGTVHVQVIVGTDGKVKQANGISGHPLLLAAAQQAVKGWRYAPTTVQTASGKSQPVEVVTVVEFQYKQ